MAKRKQGTKKPWSVPRIKHLKYPGITVRIAEFQAGGMLHVFRKVAGKQTSRSLGKRRRDLGSTTEAQKDKALAIAIDYIETLANPDAVVEPPGTKNTNHVRVVDKSRLTIGALADRYEVDGMLRVTPSYKRETLAAIRRIGSFLDANLLVRDIKPSHLEKYLASRIALHHAVAGRGAIVALSICCNWAVGEGHLDTNPLAGKPARNAMRIQHTVRQPWVEDEEFEKLKAVAAKLPPAFAVLLELADGTGKRISAILGLRWADVYFKPAEALAKCKELDARCDWLVEDFENGGIRWYAGQATNKKRRDHLFPMTAEVKAALMQWKTETLGIGVRFVFLAPGDDTRGLERHVAKKWLARAEGFAKLPHQAQSGWHAFRRRWATKRKHFALKDLMEAGDWRTLDMPAHYQQSDRASRLAVING